jgi:hypothetical protein
MLMNIRLSFCLLQFFYQVQRETFCIQMTSQFAIREHLYESGESVTFKMTHFAFVKKDKNQYDYTWNLTLTDKCKMCHFECHGLI